MAIIASDPAQRPNLQLILERVDERLTSLGLSDRAASIRATGLPDAIRELRRGKMPSDHRIKQLAKALETHPDYIAGYVDSPDVGTWKNTTSSTMPLAGAPTLPRDVPVYGISEKGFISFYSDEDIEALIYYRYNLSHPVDFAYRSPRIWHRSDVYCIILAGTEMFPRFSEGQVIYVDPRRYPAIGEDALLLLQPFYQHDRTVARAMEAELSSSPGTFALVAAMGASDSGFVTATQFQPWCDIKIPQDRVQAVHRVIPYNELLSL